MICPCGCPNTIKIPSPRKMFKRSDPLIPIRLYLATWNVLSRPPEEDLKPLLGIENVTNVNSLPDIYAIGLQEVKAAPYSILMDTFFEAPWVKALRLNLAPFNFVKLRVIRLQGILLAIFIKRPHLVYVQEIETEYTRTGIGRVWGNKGAVSIRINAFNCSICIVNCHLAAHDTELKRRIEDYNNIVDSQLFKYPQTENIFYHDYVFWLGDLNFRMNSKPLDEIISKIEQKDYKPLLQDDQLQMVQKTGEAFSELEEAPIDFAPTYKFNPGTHEYDINRRPAWTDRILHKVNANVYEDVTLEAHITNYKSHNSYTQSDHKPVSALFTIKVFQALPDRFVQFAPIKRWTIGRQHLVTIFLRAGIQTTVWDWIGLFKADFTNLDDHVAYTWVSGHGLTETVPPASTHASEHIIDSWAHDDYSGHEEGEPPWMLSERPSGSGSLFISSWLASGVPSYLGSGAQSGTASQRVSGASSQQESAIPSAYATRHASRQENGAQQTEQRLEADFESAWRRDSAATSSKPGGRRSSTKSRDRRRASRSHSPVRRISEHISTAVFRLASLFQTVPKTKYVVTFPELLAPVPGQYCLLYLSHGVDNIHGMSEPFEVRAPPTMFP